MGHINIEPPPEELSIEVKEYLTRQFINTNIALGQSQHMNPITVLPYKPQNGDTYFFGEPVLPEIEEAGYYGYLNDAYYRMDNVPEVNELPPLIELPDEPVIGGLYYFEVIIEPEIPFIGYYGYDGEVFIYLGPALIPDDILPIEPKIGGIYYFDVVIDPEIPTIGYWGYTEDGWVRLDTPDTPDTATIKAYGSIRGQGQSIPTMVAAEWYDIDFITDQISNPENVIQSLAGNYLEPEVDGIFEFSAQAVYTVEVTQTRRTIRLEIVDQDNKSIHAAAQMLVPDSNIIGLSIVSLLEECKAGNRYRLRIRNDSGAVNTTVYDMTLTMVLV